MSQEERLPALSSGRAGARKSGASAAAGAGLADAQVGALCHPQPRPARTWLQPPRAPRPLRSLHAACLCPGGPPDVPRLLRPHAACSQPTCGWGVHREHSSSPRGSRLPTHTHVPRDDRGFLPTRHRLLTVRPRHQTRSCLPGTANASASGRHAAASPVGSEPLHPPLSPRGRTECPGAFQSLVTRVIILMANLCCWTCSPAPASWLGPDRRTEGPDLGRDTDSAD